MRGACRNRSGRRIPAPIAVAAILLAAMAPLTARAAPPPNADPALSPWFESLRTKNGLSCCGEADCRRYQVRIENGHYAIHHRGEWVEVPDDAVDHSRTDNPTGDYIACVVPNRTPALVLCFFTRPST